MDGAFRSLAKRIEDDGLEGSYQGSSETLRIVIATFFGIAWYNATELCVLVFVTFSRYQGLYFWSLLVAGVAGVIPYGIGFFTKFYGIFNSPWFSVVFLSIGWWCMITGQSFVLYSRLHLVQRDQSVLKRVKIMIFTNVLLLHVPTTILTIGTNSADSKKFVQAYKVMEKVQMTGFFIQELTLSTLYIWEAVKILRLAPEKGNRKIMYQLLSINLIFIFMDLGILGAAYASLYVIETSVKATVYSIKLKLEFAVLGKLVRVVNSHSWNAELNAGPNGFPDFVDASQITTDVTRAPPCANSPPKPPWLACDDDQMIMHEHCGDSQNGHDHERSVNGKSWSTGARGNPSTPDGATTPLDVTGVIPPAPRTSSSSFPRWPT